LETPSGLKRLGEYWRVNRTPTARSQPPPVVEPLERFCRCARHARSAILSSPDMADFGTIMALRIPVGVETIVAQDRSRSGFMRACIRSHNGVDSQQMMLPCCST